MKSLALLIFISIALAFVTANAQTKDGAPANGDEVGMKEIRGWLDRWTKAFAAMDVDAIMALYTDDVIAYDWCHRFNTEARRNIAPIICNSCRSTQTM